LTVRSIGLVDEAEASRLTFGKGMVCGGIQSLHAIGVTRSSHFAPVPFQRRFGHATGVNGQLLSKRFPEDWDQPARRSLMGGSIDGLCAFAWLPG